MKSLNKTFKRDIRQNLSYYISIAVMTMLTVFLAVVAFTDADMIDADVNSVMDEYSVEDAQFYTAGDITDEDSAALEKEYDVVLEKTRFLDAEDNDKTIRIFRATEKVDRAILLDGSLPSADDEVLLDRDHANANGISIGDTYTYAGIPFRVTGLGVRPDYIYSKKNLSDMWVDKANFGMMIPTAEGYDKLVSEQDWNETQYWTVVYNNDSLKDDFRKKLYDEYNTYQYLSAEANDRISSPRGEGEMLSSEAWSLIPMLLGITMILTAIIIGRMMERERKYIGTLTAMGYRDGEISRHYSVYAMIPGVLGSVLGILLALASGKGVAMYFISDYQVINYNYYLRPLPVVLCLFVPALLFGTVAYLKAKRMLRQNITSMLLERDDKKRKKRHMLEESEMSFRKKFRFRELLAHPARTLTVLLCLFLSSLISLFSFSMNDTINNVIEKGITSLTLYDHGYYLNHVEYERDFGGYQGLNISYEMEGVQNNVTVIGIPEGSKYEHMDMKDGSYSDGGWYISNVIAVEHDIHTGDTITLINSVSLEEKKVTVDGITGDDTQLAVYTSYKNTAELSGLPDGAYNVVYSDEELDIDSEDIAYLSDEESALSTFKTAMATMQGLIYGMISTGCMLSIISVYLIVNMLIEENRQSISMLKILGYRKREINGIVLSTNHILVIIGFLLAVPMGFTSADMLCKLMVTVSHIVMTPTLTIQSIIICAVIVFASYMVSLLLLRRKVDKIDMVVSLKGNRE